MTQLYLCLTSNILAFITGRKKKICLLKNKDIRILNAYWVFNVDEAYKRRKETSFVN
jgi:hypothetical protein